MTWIDIIVALTSAPIFFGLLAPKLRLQYWWLRAWEYARQQLAIIAIVHMVCVLIFAGLSSNFIIFVLLLESLVLAYAIADLVPYTKLVGTEVDNASGADGSKISVLLFNLLQDNDEYASALEMITSRDADIVFLCEASSNWQKQLSKLEEIYPYKYLIPAEDYNGLLFYSRVEILDVKEHYLSQDHIPSLRIAMKTDAGKEICFYALHPRPPRPEDATEKLDKELLRAAVEIAKEEGPILAGGDLNEVCWSPTFVELKAKTGLLDPRIGRGIINTYDARKWYVYWPIDHLLMSKHFKLANMKRGASCGSDHHSIYYEVVLTT